MEIGKPQLARLVLGYLKTENCTKAFNEFLTTSKYLSQHALFAKNGKYFATRVGGQTLEDIINEYTEISLIIQGKLEQTSYYEEHHKMNIVEQLKYILDYEFEQCSVLPNILNTTPSESLPGNSSPKITSKSSNSQVSAAFGECSPIECPENISQILSQTLLEKPSLQKKIACVINKARKSHNQDCETEDASDQLDEKIRSIIQKAEDDYLFDNILGEIIGTKSDVPEHSNSKSYNTIAESPKVDSSKSKERGVVESSEKQITNKESVSEQSPIKLQSNSYTPNSTNLQTLSTVNSNSEVLIFNGNLDSYVGKTSSILPTNQSQIYVTNTPGVLMLPPVITAPNYFIVNNQSKQVSSVLTDTDIMKMPTVILDEGPIKHENNDIRDYNSENNITQPRRCKSIVPKSDSITISTVGNGDYLAVYKDDGQVLVGNSGRKDAPPMSKTNSKLTPKPVLRKKLPRQAKSKKKDAITHEKTQKRPATPITNVGSEPKKTTPKSGSHVRTLDFASPTSNAEEREERCSTKKVGTAKHNASKNLFKQGKKIEKRSMSSAWDAELRELLVPQKILNESPDTSYENIDADEDDAELKNQAKLIEEAFKTPSKKEPENENIILEKRSASPTREESPKDDVVEELDNQKEESVETLTVTETQLYLRNCNGPPRFKRKCNPSKNTLQTCEVQIIVEKNESIGKQLGDKKITEMTQGHVEFKKNVVLETPIKEPPKTPGKCELTPFSRELEEQIRGMDLLSLPTPYLPISPSFPITPSLDLNTPVHASRPTDYSTSSSYYQPSDTEQNKSLEAMIEECKKLEKRSQNVTEEECENRNPSSAANDIKRVFNQTVIGKKNLNLMKQNSSSSESSDDSDSSCSSSENSSSSDSDCDKTPVDDVIRKGTYCLRRRTTTPKSDEKVIKPASPAKTSKTIKSLAEEIIDKRERVLKLLKNDNKDGQKTPQNVNQAKEKICKTIKKSSSRRKNRSPIKLKTNEQITKLFDVENEITDDDFALHLSTDEDSVNKPAADGTTAKDKEENSAIPSSAVNRTLPTDLEAEQLVQGLKERGIHLMHKKSPNKNDSGAMKTDKKKEIDSLPAEHDSEANSVMSHESRQVISKIEERDMENKEIDIPITANVTNLNTSSNDLDVSFNVEYFSEEQQFKVNFINSKRKSKKAVYDSNVLTKEMKANVYIETLDMEMERIIKCTSFEVLLDIAAKKAIGKNKKKVLKSDQSLSCPPAESQEKFKSKLNMCDTKAINRGSKNTTCRKTSVSEKKVLAATKSDKSNQPTTARKSKSTSKRGVSEKCAKIDSSRGKDNVETKTENVLDSASTSNVGAVDVSMTLEKDSSCNKDKVLNVQWDSSPVLKAEEDELMNYAVMGSQREEIMESPKGGSKRKCSSLEDGEPLEKKCKTEQRQALLKKIDVDTFLNKVHGNAEKAQP